MLNANIHTNANKIDLKLESTLKELQLWQVEIDLNGSGNDLIKLFDADPLLPGVICTREGDYVGMISRSTFFDHMSRPYSLGLYSQRPVDSLYNKLHPKLFFLAEDTTIVTATQKALERSQNLIYEPILVICKDGKNRVLDFHQLVVANSYIHALTLAQLQQAEKKTEAAKTDLRSLQEKYSRSLHNDKMASLGQLVAGIAHEINNPVNFITGNLVHTAEYTQELLHLVNLYQKYCPHPEEEIQTVLQEIDLDFLTVDLPNILLSMQMGAERIKQIILSLRNFSRLDEAEQKIVDIHEGIDNTLLILRNRLQSKYHQENSISVVKEYSNLPLVQCYPGQLNQVFLHILNNAIDALEEKAQHSQMQIGIPPQLKIHIQTQLKDHNYLTIRIHDNGLGIKEEIKEQIFDPFFTTKPVGKGTGMGLSICHQIVVEKHGGELKCLSTPGKGTEFILQIPIVKTKQYQYQRSVVLH
ncbi:MAG: ATP-binding protein [Calothrix sp. MO_167.B12]|nr:ATP-binding protein [Calothrix sp. MO_167.B12]